MLAALATSGVDRPWSHQRRAAELAHAGTDVVLATGTASGKSLGYQLPALAAIAHDPRSTVLYLSPTKALAADQLAALDALPVPGLRAAAFDGDTPLDERDWARDHANWLLTNPDMLHRRLLPHHSSWIRLLRRLRYVVVDECHAYRGVFGSHVALVLRRLVRVAAAHGARPVFVLASATAAHPAGTATRLVGRPVVAVTDDHSSRPAADFVLWEPAEEAADERYPGPRSGSSAEPRAGARRLSAPAATARLLADLVAGGSRTLAFVRSRQGAEQVAIGARRRLQRIAPELAPRVAVYRGGYLPEDRRAIETALDSGELLGVASTNALELGIDIAGLDAAVIAGYPGSLAALWQQAGRAGRGGAAGRRALIVFVAGEDPLDTYLVRHPETILGRSVEAAVIDPTNPFVLGPHLTCAAAEHHLSAPDLELFGGHPARAVLDQLVGRRILRRRPSGYFWTNPGHPAEHIDLRGAGTGQVAIVDRENARLLGTVDAHRAPGTVHTGAVHLHQGESYLVDELDLGAGVAFVRAERPGWTTVPRTRSSARLVGPLRDRPVGPGVRAGAGPIELTTQVVGYLRRRPNGEVLDHVELDLPSSTLPTRAVWFAVDGAVLHRAGLRDAEVPGALHAAEHAAIALLPLFAGCDRSDVGGLSVLRHPDTGASTVIVHDCYPGGAGFADRGYEALLSWLTATRDAVAGCPCAAGCPGCVHSPRCGSGNHPLHKSGAHVVLQVVVDALAAAPEESVGA